MTKSAAGATSTGGGRPATDDGRPGPRERLAVGLLLFSAFVVILNETVMGVAIPELKASLDIDASQAQWVTTAFMLTMAVVIPVTGFVIQRTTTRRVFLTAMGLFSLGTLVCAVAPGFELLVAGRVVQASGTAIMMPLLMTTVMTVTPPASRGRTMGNVSVVISVAPALGPTISGLVLERLEWRWLFVFVLPIALGALALGAARLPDVTTPRRTPLPLLSLPVAALAFGGIVFGLSHLGEGGATRSWTSWAPLAVGGLALVVFVLLQLWLQRSDRALLDLRPFTSRTFTVSVLLMTVLMTSLFGTIIVLPIFAQDVLGLSVLGTGLLLLPGGLLMGVAAPTVGRLYDRHGPRVLLVPGAVLVSAAMWTLTLLRPGSPTWHILVAHVLLSLGLALSFTPLFSASLGSLPGRLYPHGSALVGTVQQLAGAVGIAVFVTVLTLRALERPELGVVGATAEGVHAAFLVGAVVSLVALPVTLLVRAPANGAGGHGPVEGGHGSEGTADHGLPGASDGGPRDATHGTAHDTAHDAAGDAGTRTTSKRLAPVGAPEGSGDVRD